MTTLSTTRFSRRHYHSRLLANSQYYLFISDALVDKLKTLSTKDPIVQRSSTGWLIEDDIAFARAKRLLVRIFVMFRRETRGIAGFGAILDRTVDAVDNHGTVEVLRRRRLYPSPRTRKEIVNKWI